MKTFTTESTYDSIIVIESLPEAESQTGLVLVRDTLTLECNLKSLGLTHFDCNSKPEFLHFFDRLEQSLLSKNGDVVHKSVRSPILHFEIHGSTDKDGLVLKDGSFVNWSLFRECIQKINRATNNNTIVVMAVCNGYWATPGIVMSKLTPFYAMVAPSEPITVGTINKIFPTFYKEAFETGNLITAFEKVKNDCALFHCEFIFARCIAKYFKEHCSGEILEERIESLTSEVVKKYPSMSKNKLVKLAEEQLKPSERIFNKYRSKFLLAESPINKGRFTVSFSDLSNFDFNI